MDLTNYRDYDISSAQRRIYVLNKISGKNTVYNMPSVLRLKEHLEPDVIQEAFQKVILRHESLRTSFMIEDGKVIQRVFEHVDFQIEHDSLQHSDELKSVVQKFVRPFPLDKAPLFRVAIIQIGDTQHLLLDMHHIISDGKSENIIMNDFYAYAEGKELPPLTLQYRDCFQSENALQKNATYMKHAKDFWQKAFQPVNEELHLPTDYPRDEIQQFAGDRKAFSVGKEVTKQVKSICETYKVTMNHFLMAVYSVMISKVSKQEDIVIGTPVSARRNAEQEKVVGLFLNTLPIRTYPSANKSFCELLNEIKHFMLMAMKYRNYTLEMLVNDVNFPKDTSRNPIFDVAFLLNSNIVIDAQNCESYYRTENAKVDLSIEVTNSEDNIHFLMEYCTKLFKPETCEKFGNLYTHILEQVARNPEIKIKDIIQLTIEEKEKVLYKWNDTKLDYNQSITINDLIEQQVNAKKEDIALVCGSRRLTYGEINKSANQIAICLREKNIGRNDIVAVMMNPGIDMVLTILGIIKAGAAYLPIGVDTPAQRVDYIVKDSRAKLLVTDHGQWAGEIAYVIDKDLITTKVSDQFDYINEPEDLLYVIYTSGSTGNPKGVMVQHKNVVNYRYGINQAVHMKDHKKILLLTTICFDISVMEMIIPLTLGLEVMIVEKQQQQDILYLLKYIEDNQIDFLQFTPSRFQLFTLAPNWQRGFNYVKTLLIGGEAFPETLVDKVMSLENTKTYNVYGPTETTIWSTIKKVDGQKITIGKPIANTQIYILDKNQECVGIGETGEIYIAGAGLTKGYRNNLNLTKKKFIQNPYTGSLMYATGDLGRWNADGEIEYLGRIDFQIKIRGYRIEIGEIEQKILQYTGVTQTAVIDMVGENDNKYLCAYVTGEITDLNQLKIFLKQSLPEYMIPSFFIKLTKMPLNHNGKIDRIQLPLPKRKMDSTNEAMPITSAEGIKIKQIWQQVLNLEEIDDDEDFFDMGGNSLLAIKADLLFEQANMKVNGQNIYQYRTVRKLANYLEEKKSEKSDNKEVAKMKEDTNSEIEAEVEELEYGWDAIVIDGINPYNDMFFESCFYNSLFAILIYYGIDIVMMLRQYVIYYQTITQEGRMQFSADGNWNNDFLHTLTQIGVNYTSIDKTSDVVADTKKAIDNGDFVIVWIDCFYESYRKDKYHKQHFMHTITIYGYSNLQQEFYILEHKVAENTNYHKVKISFEELDLCYKGYLEYLFQKEEASFYRFSRQIDQNININAPLKDTAFVPSVWDRKQVIQWKEYFMAIEESKVEPEDISYWLTGLNKLLNFLQIDVIKCKGRKEFEQSKERSLRWTIIRNSLVRAYYLKRYTKNNHQKNINLLEEIIELEGK